MNAAADPCRVPFMEAIDLLTQLLSGAGWTAGSEFEFQQQAKARLSRANIQFREEHVAGSDRFDLIVGRIVLELKVKGSPNKALQQCECYARRDDVDGVILLSTKSSHRKLCGTRSLFGKPFRVVNAVTL